MSTFTVTTGTPPATVTIVATFQSTINGSRHEAGDLERLTLGILLDDNAEWETLLSLVTTKYHVHAPFAGEAILDIVRGPGVGSLVVDGLGTTDALLISLDRPTYLPASRSMGSAVFLVTGVVI